MDPKILKTGTAEFTRASWDGQNRSGFVPMSNKVMIMPDHVADRTTGGVFLSDNLRERHTMAAESGIIVAMGTEAFKTGSDGRPWVGVRPTIGAHVYFERYAGQVLHGRDGQLYRMMDQQCVGALGVEEEAA